MKKRKVAAIIGYNGADYLGSQINGDLPTIDRDLERALVAGGAIAAENAGQLSKVGWSRCARTDKGVSAAANVVGLNVLLPTHVEKDASEEEKQKRNAVDSEENIALEEKDAAELAEKVRQHLPPKICLYGFKRTTGGFDARKMCDARTYQYVVPAAALVRGGYVAEEGKEPVVDLEYVNALLKFYEKSHNYHNFTIRKQGWEKSCIRLVYSAVAQAPKTICGMSVVSIVIHGQSFMLLQIRKMISLVLMLVRLDCSLEMAKRIFDDAFSRMKINIPPAPALGLFLEHPWFTRYNQRVFENEPSAKKRKDSEGGAVPVVPPRSFQRGPLLIDEWAAEMEKFKEEMIIPHIIEGERSDNVMAHWMGILGKRIELGFVKITEEKGLECIFIPHEEMRAKGLIADADFDLVEDSVPREAGDDE